MRFLGLYTTDAVPFVAAVTGTLVLLYAEGVEWILQFVSRHRVEELIARSWLVTREVFRRL